MKKLIISFIVALTIFTVTGCTTEQATVLPSEFVGLEAVLNLYPGQQFLPYKDVTATDPVDGNLSSSIEITGLDQLGLSGEFNVTTIGTFVLEYSVTNSGGIKTVFEVTINIGNFVSDLEYELVWSDEFNYTGLPDERLWGYDVGGSGWGNGESQYYTDGDADNAYVDNGYLTITAIQEDYSNSEYTSARLVSIGEGNWTYGKFEIKAKLPAGTGVWPAIWMLPTDWIYGGWPASGEIDIMEYVGYDVDTVYYTIHTQAYNHSIGTQVGEHASYEDVSNVFHEYQLEWLPDVLIWSIDDIEVYRYTVPEGAPLDYTTWPFNTDFHLLLNIAVGGSWGGAQGIDTDIWPQEMVIDYVRVYQDSSVSE